MSAPTLFNQPLSLKYLEGLTRDTSRTEKRSTYDNAINTYRIAREKFLDVNRWSENSRLKSADYVLTDAYGAARTGFACDGDHIRFEVGDDKKETRWMLIERVLEVNHDDWRSFAMRLKEVPSPFLNKAMADSCNISGDSYTLILERSGHKIISYVHQRSAQNQIIQPRKGIFSKLAGMFKDVQSEIYTDNRWDAVIDAILK